MIHYILQILKSLVKIYKCLFKDCVLNEKEIEKSESITRITSKV